MAKISIYPLDGDPKLSDKLIGTSVGYSEGGELKDPTYNFSLQQLLDLFLPNIPANTLQGVLDYGNTATEDINLFGKITTTNLEVTNISNLLKTYISEEIHIQGSLFDISDSQGTSGQILTSTGSGVQWITPANIIPTLEEVLNSGNESDIDIILTADIYAQGINADTVLVQDSFELNGSFIDSDGSTGTSGQMLTSLGSTGVSWKNVPVYTASSPLFVNPATKNITIQQANSTQNGYLSYADWISFDGKQNALSGTGIVVSNGGTISYITNNSNNWNLAYNDTIVSVAVSGSATKTLTLTQRDGGTLTANWQDESSGISLTTVGTSGVATLVSGVLNIPNYTIDTSEFVHIEGDEFIYDVKKFYQTDSIVSHLEFNNTRSIDGLSSIEMVNTDGASSIDIVNSGAGEGINILNSGEGYGQIITNDGIGYGLLVSNNGAGSGGIGGGIKIIGSSYAPSFTISNSAQGDAIFINSVGASAGTPINLQQDGVTNFQVSKLGDVTANKLIKSGGTSVQYLMADGSVSTGPSLTGYVPYTGATQNVNLGEYGISAGYFQSDLTPTGALQVGRMQWNSTDGTMDLRLMGNNVTLQIGQENVTRVVNKSGVNLLEENYQVVRVRKVAEGGAQGQRLAVVLAQGNNENNSTEVLGLVTETINVNQEGFVTAFGEVKNINTTGSLQGETWVDGDILYVSTSVAGQLTNIRPVAPNHAVTVGYVTYSHANNGKIYMAIDTGYELGELHNVYAPSPTANQSIYWNTTNSRYELNTIGGILGYTPANAATTISTTSPLQGGGDLSSNRTFSITQSGTASNGYLSSTDWNTFNNKQPAGSYVPTSRLLSINGTSYDLSTDRSWSVGTVTSVAALTIGTSGTDLSSSVATGTTTPVITLNVPTASAANRGALSAADWSTFNTKVGGVTASSPLASSGGSTPNITIQQSSGSQDGYLSSTDWTTFNSKQAAGNYITSLTGEATASGPGAASVTLNNASVTGKVLTGVNITGGTVQATDTMLTAFGKLQNQINGLIGSTIYQGTWNASTNTPALSSGVGVRGYYYIVSVAGSTNLDGITDWSIGDWAIFDGTAWQQVDNTDAVVSVNGQTGAVSLTTDNIPEGSTNQYYLNSRARAALSFTAGSGAYNSTTGVITIPTNTSQLTNGANFITLASLSGTAPIQYNNTTGVISITQSGTASNGYLSSTDWNTFNNKQSVITNPVTGIGTTNYVPKWTSGSAIGNSLIYDNGTNVGIGTTSPSGKLTVSASDSHLQLVNGSYSNYLVTNSIGNLYFQPNGSFNAMAILQNGNVGIGTTSPMTKLTVNNGVVRTNTTPTYSSYIHTNDTDDFRFGLATILKGGATGADRYVALESSTYQVSTAAYTGGLNLILNPNGGNIGIGTTSPSALLDIVGASATEQFRIGNTTGGTDFGITVTENASTIINSAEGATGRGIQFQSGGTNTVLINSSGSVGIGTTSPAAKLDIVVANSSTSLSLRRDVSGTVYQYGSFINSGSDFMINGNGSVFINADSDSDSSSTDRNVIFGNRGTAYMHLYSGGNLGINTGGTDAGYKLDVNGTGRFSGTLRISSTTPTQEFFSTGNGDVWGSIKAEASTGTGGQLVLLAKRNGNTEVARVRITENGNTLFYPPNFSPAAISGIGSPYYGSNITLASDTGSTQGANRIWSRYDATGRAALTFETATNSQSYQSDPTGLTYTEYMRITGLGNVGINTEAPVYKLDVNGGSTAGPAFRAYKQSAAGDGSTALFINTSATGYSSYIYIGSAPGTDWKVGKNITTSGSAFPNFQITDDANNIGLQINSGTRNVLIGTTTDAGYKLYVNGDGRFNGTIINPVDNSGIISGNDANIGFVKKAGYPGHITTATGAGGMVFSRLSTGTISPSNISGGTLTTLMTISDSGGVTAATVAANSMTANTFTASPTSGQIGFLAVTTSTTPSIVTQMGAGGSDWVGAAFGGAYGTAYNSSSVEVVTSNYGTGIKITTGVYSASQQAIQFKSNTTTVGSITCTTSATAYNTSSDYRLKENVVPMESSINRLKELNPCRFNFINNPDKTVDGFIAHEVQEVIPEAITGEKDELDYDGSPKYQGIDQSKIVPLLTAALQEAISKIEELENRLSILENK